MDNTKRVKIACHQCGRDFSLLREFDGRPTFHLPCPFCGATNVVDLDPYRTQVHDIYAGNDAPPLTLEFLNLPDVLPGRAPRPDEELD